VGWYGPGQLSPPLAAMIDSMTCSPDETQSPWWQFVSGGRIVFGAGCGRFVGAAAREFGDRVLVCTDQNLQGAGIIEPIARRLRAEGLESFVFDEGRAEISIGEAEACAESVRDFAPTVVVGIGGGSNLDLAKVVAARLTTTRPITDWASEGVPSSALPIVAIPTTAGTGSEVTSVAVLTDEVTGVKIGLPGRAFLPRVALVDSTLTFSCPTRVTADAGMDALTHALEALLAIDFTAKPVHGYGYEGFVGKNPLSDTLALKAIALVGTHLANAVRDGRDVAARDGMALASLLAGMAFASAGTAVVHALQYPLGMKTKTPHGMGNAALLPAALRFNLGVHPADELEAARALTGDHDVEASILPDIVAVLAMRIGVAPNLSALGVTRSDLGPMAAAAASNGRLVSNNARRVDQHGLLVLLESALGFMPDSAVLARYLGTDETVI